MGSIIFKISLIGALVAFLVFMAIADRRNRLARDAEERRLVEAERRRRADVGAGER